MKALDAMAGLEDVAPLPDAVAALGEALGARGVCPLDPAVPDAVWLEALVGPAAVFLARPGKDVRARLVRAGWRAAGGDPADEPRGVARVIELLHAGSLIVDDVEDDARDRRGGPALHRLVGVPVAINTGSWLYFWALAELARLEIPGALASAVATLARCHQGQALDLATRVDQLAARDVPGVVAATTRLKTAALCRLAVELGARAANASPELRASLGGLGERAGIALQMLDDLSSITSRPDKAREDLAAARPTWPWAWLAEQDDPFAWARGVHELAAITAGRGDPDALAGFLAERVAAHGKRRAGGLLASLDHPVFAEELRAMEAMYG